MGLTSSKKDFEKSEFYREAFGFKTLKITGLAIEDNSRNKKHLGNGFDQEIIEYADESGDVKPWLANVLAPDIVLDENNELPLYTLKIDHVFGFRTEDTRKNLFFYGDEEIIYSISSLCILQNLDDNTQRLFGGFPLKENKECHDGNIVSMAFLKSEVSMVATGQIGMNPKILVWSPEDTNVVYAKFLQPKGSKQVSALDFDKNGQYLASYGQDDLNTFYFFNLKKKVLEWSCPTSEVKDDEFLSDMCFNTGDENNLALCLVGVNKIVFSHPINRDINIIRNFKRETIIYTCCCYTNPEICAIGTDKGKLLIYEGKALKHKMKLCIVSIQCIIYKPNLRYVFVSDSFNRVSILDDVTFKTVNFIKLNSVVKSMDVNDDFTFIFGLKNGDIIIDKYDIKNDEGYLDTFLKSHSVGSIGGLAYVPEFKLLTSGEDNQILLWNLKSRRCENSGIINDLVFNDDHQTSEDIRTIGEQNKSQCLAYNQNNEHVAVGINIGTVTIRKSPKQLNSKVRDDIALGTQPIIELKYTKYGDKLLVSSESGELFLLDVNNNYQKEKSISSFSNNDNPYMSNAEFGNNNTNNIKNNEGGVVNQYITYFDFDMQAKYMQCATNDNKYIFIDYENFNVVDALECRCCQWETQTVKFGYLVQGIFQGSTKADYISAVCKANNVSLLAAGDDDFLLNICNYPCITENPKLRKYRGHCGNIKRIFWTNEDEQIVTIAENDKAIIVWKMEELKYQQKSDLYHTKEDDEEY